VSRGWVVALLALPLLGSCRPRGSGEPPAVELQEYPIGGDFELAGREPFHLTRALDGRVGLLFFGYTVCPDVCPMTLSKLAQVYAALGDDGERVVTVFVSLDPERDSPEQIREYLSFYGVNAVGTTGSREELDALVHRYGGSYTLEPVDSAMEYLVSHASYVYLLDPSGRVRHLFSHLDDAARIEAGVRRLLDP
jgi:protein SCO1/2